MFHRTIVRDLRVRFTRLAAALTIATSSLTMPVVAQETPSPARSLSERVYLYADSRVHLTPGKGLGSVVIGMPLESVVRVFGAPLRSDRSGIINRRTTLLYEAGVNAWIRIIGDKTVEEIGVEGRTEMSTPQGVRFGMPGHQVKLIYGEPVVTEEGAYRYPERGIGFTFRSGLVYQMEAFAPAPRE